MTSAVEDIICSSHDVKVAMFIHHAAVSCAVVSWVFSEVLLDEELIVSPESEHERWRHWELDDHSSKLASWKLFLESTRIIFFHAKNLELIADAGLSGRAWECGKLMKIVKVRADWPACLCLPVVIIEENAGEFLSKPPDCIRVASLSY